MILRDIYIVIFQKYLVLSGSNIVNVVYMTRSINGIIYYNAFIHCATKKIIYSFIVSGT